MFQEHEKSFLAQVAIGMFRVDDQGRVWRQKVVSSGSRRPRMLLIKDVRESRAETAIKQGYLGIPFGDGEKRMCVRAHRIVWMIHNGLPIPDGLQVNHKNGNRKDNLPSNLEVVTAKENMRHAGQVLKTLGKRYQLGPKNSSAKLTVEQVVEIKTLLKVGGLSCKQIAKMFSVSEANIYHISNGKTWSHVILPSTG